MDRQPKDHDATINSSTISRDSDVFESTSSNNAKPRAALVEWLNGVLPDLNLPINASDEELRAFLIDGSILCRILNKLKPGFVTERARSSQPRLENVQRFLSTMDEMGFPRFQAADLEKGSMRIVLDCLLTLKTHFTLNAERYNRSGNGGSSRWKQLGERVGSGDGGPRDEPYKLFSSPPFGEDRRKLASNSRSLRGLRSPLTTEQSTAPINQECRKLHEAFQFKQGSYTDLPAAKISEMMKSNSLDNAPTQSLLSVVNGILDESIELKNGEIPHRVACLLRKVVQEIERRICTQAEHLRTQNNLFKAREEKYQSRIKVLEALATGTGEETQIVMNQLQQIKSEKNKIEEKKKVEEHDIVRLMKEKDDLNQEIANLRQKLEMARRSCDEQSLKTRVEPEGTQHELENRSKEASVLPTESSNRVKELENRSKEVLILPTESSNRVKVLEDRLKEALRLQTDSGNRVKELEDKLEETLSLLTESRNRVKEFEDRSKEAKNLQSDSGNRVNELEDRLKEALSSQTESRNRVKELEDKLKEALSLQSDSGNRANDLEDRLKEALSLQTESRNRVKELEDKLKEALSSQTESRNKVKELEDRLKEAVSLQSDSGSRVMELEDKLKETLNLLSESRNRVKEFEDKLKDALILQTESRNRVRELEDRLKELEDRLKETLSLLTESRNRVKELEALSASKSEEWSKKQHIYHISTEFQLGALRELRFASQSIQQELVRTQKSYSEEFNTLGARFRILDEAAKNYYSQLAENQKLHNELQELKGNIRVYCRIRPFLPGQKGKQSIVEYTGENGELIVVNPAKPGKEGRRSFKFNKVYGSSATQEDVFSDIQPLVQSVLDGYNVCIFAYGQTGSGKTYTMTGPDGATEKDWGVNYRALNSLFRISQSRQGNFKYEVSVQMVEIYNEQVRDLLSNASIRVVNATSDVLDLMDIGLKNRAKGSTAMNERSSRSHSVVSIHAHGKDLKSGSSLRGSLHLVDLAGSERVDRSEVTGDRLKEAQHINKSLSALGDVIFALAQKSSHVPYRNSKLTQVLQSSLGGQAKTLMFVQLNPDTVSFSESLSTLKFAERVSGVELGAAKSSKDGRDVRELMEQVASLKDTIAKKDEEIETLQLLKDSEKRSQR
ncbi:kinesin kp1 [Phtheirospermum japonicum]|uniref:Kinesin kp1 n=1 Tax=Phtheirospermum japonicum TaxID=374723 RepID=A0A830CFB7_9LAMI|nr:kinesin kp1 [Phtheirospermum japonicum]